MARYEGAKSAKFHYVQNDEFSRLLTGEIQHTEDYLLATEEIEEMNEQSDLSYLNSGEEASDGVEALYYIQGEKIA